MTAPEPRKHIVRIELEYEQELDWQNAQDYAEYLLAPVLATLDTLGMTAKQVEIFDTEDPDHYAELLKEDIEAMNAVGEVEGEDDDEDEDD